MKPVTRRTCLHRHWMGTVRYLETGHRLDRRICTDCDAPLPLGPSVGDSAVEIRAAELATTWICGPITDDEFDGWCERVRPDSDAYQAGFLAGCIANHDTEQRMLATAEETNAPRAAWRAPGGGP